MLKLAFKPKKYNSIALNNSSVNKKMIIQKVSIPKTFVTKVINGLVLSDRRRLVRQPNWSVYQLMQERSQG
ncbi:hypothetical protein A6770_28090 [Nostoc minutum NIES-26]|uniref:Uncharacterized protein n=1 Tax=Nostoc minutum NIES-26 TaxID=1844469 RepID=A0A367QLM4_9NOSO|nr:hypothetical protein A6770_28090 [Nostoc minutum NIES-26]